MHLNIHKILVFMINGASIFVSHRATKFSGPALVVSMTLQGRTERTWLWLSLVGSSRNCPLKLHR